MTTEILSQQTPEWCDVYEALYARSESACARYAEAPSDATWKAMNRAHNALTRHIETAAG